MNYFLYQLKLEIIPYFQQEIHQYLNQLQLTIFSLSSQQKQKAKNLLNKKLIQIEKFYDKNYLDFRAHMVLKSRQLITQFLQKYSKEFPVIVGQIDMKQKLNEIRKNTAKNIDSNKIKAISAHSSGKVLRGLAPNFKSSLQKKKDSDLHNSYIQPKTHLHSSESKGLVTSSSMLLPSPKEKQNLKLQSPKIDKTSFKSVSNKINQHQYIEYLKNKNKGG